MFIIRTIRAIKQTNGHHGVSMEKNKNFFGQTRVVTGDIRSTVFSIGLGRNHHIKMNYA